MTIFRGEMQLLRWSETSTGGATVTFQLADVGDLNGFKDLTMAKKGMAGQRIAAIMVPVEDEQDLAPEHPAPVEPKQKPGDLCIVACNYCKDPAFLRWVGAIHPNGARQFILDKCLIKSRKDLDTDKMAATRFLTLIREPYMAWRAAQ